MTNQKSSILISFVGRQDPFARPKDPADPVTEGSLVSLIKFLKERENRDISRAILLYSIETEEGAKDCQEWLNSEYNLPLEHIQLQAISEELSNDPIDLELAVEEAQKVLQQAQLLIERGESEWIDFNTSSGTPTMKQTWGILQAAGYAPNSTVWQVRDPKFCKPNQKRVFTSNLSRLKVELDLKVIRQQVERYDYAGVLDYLKSTQFNKTILRKLLEYGRTRLAFDAKLACECSEKLTQSLDKFSLESVKDLKNGRPECVLRELYWQAKINYENKNYANVIIFTSAFLEHAFRLEIKHYFKIQKNLWNRNWKTIETNVWDEIKKYDNGKLYEYLERKKENLKHFDRIVFMYVLEYVNSPNLEYLKVINNCAPIRNNYIHEMKGISNFRDDQTEVDIDKVFDAMKTLLEAYIDLPKNSAFELLNHIIFDLLQEFI
jgi:hypothetical protein